MNNFYKAPNQETKTFSEKENYCERQFLQNGPIWHFYTDGTNQAMIFKTADDFKYGINQLAISALMCNVTIISFALMDNHCHVIAKCPKANGEQMFERFSKKVRQYLKSAKRPVPDNLLKLQPAVEITTLRMIRTEIIYVIRNGFVSCSDYIPTSYPWGSGTLYFQIVSTNNATPFNELPYIAKRSILRSRVYDLPKEFLVENGMILPSCFCDFQLGQSMFRDGHNYFSMLSKDIESYGEIAKRMNDSVFYTDEELYSAISQLTRKLTGLSDPQIVNSEQKIELAKRMHSEYKCSNKQIQRLLKLDAAVLNSLFPQPK